MALAKACLGSLAEHIRSRVPECNAATETSVSVPGLGMEFYADEVTARGCGDDRSVTVVFEARAIGSAETGIRVLALGVGRTEEAAAVDAGHQWATGVVPVLMSYLLPDQHVAEVQKSPMIVGVAETRERYGWTVHIGTVLTRLYGPPSVPEIDRGDVSHGGAYRPVFEALHPFAAHEHLMWVESFAARYPDKRVDATARLQNREWPEGRDALLAWAASWPDTDPFILSKRQFVVLEPTPLDQLKSSGDLAGRLEREMARGRRPWWRRLFGGA